MKKICLIAIVLIETMMLFSQEKTFKSYVGKWKIDNVFVLFDGEYLCLGDILEEEEAYAYKGKIIEYERDGIIFGGEKLVTTQKVKEEFFTDEQLKAYTTGSWYPGYYFKDLGITSNIIKEVLIYVHDKKIGYYAFGFGFFQINDNEILINYRGWFYHAVRIS